AIGVFKGIVSKHGRAVDRESKLHSSVAKLNARRPSGGIGVDAGKAQLGWSGQLAARQALDLLLSLESYAKDIQECRRKYFCVGQVDKSDIPCATVGIARHGGNNVKRQLVSVLACARCGL